MRWVCQEKDKDTCLSKTREDHWKYTKSRYLWKGRERSWVCSYLAPSLFSVRKGALLARKEGWKKLERDVRTGITASAFRSDSD